MAVVADEYLPFDSGPGASVQESGWRNMMKHMVGSASGVIRGFGNDCNTFGDSSGMQVKMNTGECFMRGHYGNFTSQKTLAIASNASGSTRIDIVVLRAHFANNNIVVDVVTGTPGGSAPSVTQNTTMWETKLAEVTVTSGAATITAGNVNDRRVYTTVVAKYSRNTTLSNVAGGTGTDIVYNTTEIASGDVTPNSFTSPSQFTLNRSGLWVLTANSGWAGANTSVRALRIMDGSSNILTESAVSSSVTNSTILIATMTDRFSAGQTVKVNAFQNTAGALNINTGTNFTMLWIGP